MDSHKLEQLRNSVEKLASEDEFEKMHFMDVERNILHLSEIRHLDNNTAKLIAWLHDIARIKYGYRGKKHAKEGKKEAREILAKLGVDEKTIGIVARAIGNHRKKDRIDDEYSELIKDADCLSHNTEFNGAIDEVEKARCRLAEKGECRLISCAGCDPLGILNEKWGELETLLERTASGGADAETVHETRICIRNIRAILKIMKSGNIKLFEDDLKAIFKKYSDLRECHVLRQQVKKACKIKWLEERLESVHERMISELAEDIKSLVKLNGIEELRRKISKIQNGQDLSILGAGAVMNDYSDAVRLSEMDDVESLHRMRIKGKTVKYLVELGLFEMDEECFKLVNSMHGEIGRLHDIDVNRAFINGSAYLGGNKLSKEEMKCLESHFKKMEDNANLIIEKDLFDMKLRLRKP